MCRHTAIDVSPFCYKSSVLILLVLRHSRDLYRHGRRAEESAACERMSRKEIQAELDAMNQEHKRIKAESILPPDASDERDTRQLSQAEEHRRLKAAPHSEASRPSHFTLSGLVDSQCSKCRTQCAQSLPSLSVTLRDSSHLQAVARGGDKNENDTSLAQLHVRSLLRENAECRAEIRQLGDEVFALYVCMLVTQSGPFCAFFCLSLSFFLSLNVCVYVCMHVCVCVCVCVCECVSM